MKILYFLRHLRPPQLVYPPTEDSYYDYPYPGQEHFLPSQTERISNNFLAEPAYYGYC